MHELSIAYTIVETASAAAQQAGALKVKAVYVRLGMLAGIVKQSLLFSFDIASQGSVLADAMLIIEEVPVSIFCPQCQLEVELVSIQSFRCPHCHTPSGQMMHGRELEIIALEIEEQPEHAATIT